MGADYHCCARSSSEGERKLGEGQTGSGEVSLLRFCDLRPGDVLHIGDGETLTVEDADTVAGLRFVDFTDGTATGPMPAKMLVGCQVVRS